MTETLSPELLLRAYASGIFPMAESRDDVEIFWVEPQMRGIFPLDNFHISRSLSKAIRQKAYTIRTNAAFEAVVEACADREETWINPTIFSLYRDLHKMGHAHSIEVYENQTLIGGVYGVTLGTAFFGESMFSRRTNGSKIALAYLIDRLQICGFTLFDTQFLTPHLASLGAVEIPRKEYLKRLRQAVELSADFNNVMGTPTPQEILQRNTQTS
jgi:leucyl/phenylalanyl-tRNA--protein transferase